MRWKLTISIVLATVIATFAEAETSSAVRAILDAGVHPNLQRKDFAPLCDSLRTVYEARAFAPLWIENGRLTRSARSVLEGLGDAERVGLRPADYDVESLHALVATLHEEDAPTPDTVARLDTGLTIATMRYVEDAYSGRVEPRRVGFGLEVPPKMLDLPGEIHELASSRESEPLAKFNPPFPIFARLVAKLAHFRDLAVRTVPVIEEVKKIQPRGVCSSGAGRLDARADRGGDETWIQQRTRRPRAARSRLRLLYDRRCRGERHDLLL